MSSLFLTNLWPVSRPRGEGKNSGPLLSPFSNRPLAGAPAFAVLIEPFPAGGRSAARRRRRQGERGALCPAARAAGALCPAARTGQRRGFPARPRGWGSYFCRPFFKPAFGRFPDPAEGQKLRAPAVPFFKPAFGRGRRGERGALCPAARAGQRRGFPARPRGWGSGFCRPSFSSRSLAGFLIPRRGKKLRAPAVPFFKSAAGRGRRGERGALCPAARAGQRRGFHARPRAGAPAFAAPLFQVGRWPVSRPRRGAKASGPCCPLFQTGRWPGPGVGIVVPWWVAFLDFFVKNDASEDKNYKNPLDGLVIM